MEFQTAFDVLLGLAGALGGWIMKTLHDEQKDLRKRLDEIPETYARRDDVQRGFDQLNQVLVRIEEKIDRKQDRH